MTEKQFKCTNISANGMTGLFWLGKDQISVYDVLKILNDLSKENEQLKDDVYDEMDDALEVLVELYEYVPFDSQKKMNKLYNRLKSLRDDMNG